MRRRSGSSSQSAIAWNGSSRSMIAPTAAKTQAARNMISRQVAAEHERVGGRLCAARIVGGPAADVAKAGARVEFSRRRIVLVHLEKHRGGAEAGEAAQVQVEQLAAEAAAAPRRGHRDREDLGLAGRKPRDDEAGERAAGHGAMGNDVALDEQALDLVLAPAAAERGGVQRGERSGIAR